MFENIISKILQTIRKQLNNFLPKISRQLAIRNKQFYITKENVKFNRHQVKTQVASLKVNTLFEVIQF